LAYTIAKLVVGLLNPWRAIQQHSPNLIAGGEGTHCPFPRTLSSPSSLPFGLDIQPFGLTPDGKFEEAAAMPLLARR